MRQRAALEELQRLARALGEGIIPDSLRGILQEGKFPAKASAQVAPSNINAPPSCVHPVDARRKAAAEKLRALLDRGAAAVTSGSGTTGTRDPTHLSRASCGTVSAGNPGRDEQGRTLEEWAEHCIRNGACPPRRDVTDDATTPAAEDVNKVAQMLLADPRKIPVCELGCPSTRRREGALKLLQQGLGIKYIEAERLLALKRREETEAQHYKKVHMALLGNL